MTDPDIEAEFHNLDDVAEIRRLQAERAAAIDRLTPLGCENEDLRAELARARLRIEALSLLLYGPAPPQSGDSDAKV
jgi:hypothetical protein